MLKCKKHAKPEAGCFTCVIVARENRNTRVYKAHLAQAKAAHVSTDCTVHHVNFGGGCLNCGFDPKKVA